MGVTSGSPVHFIGNPFARTIYVTEGLLKADIAHFLMNRSFVAIAGANNAAQLEPLFALLAQNGTELIVEAHDMDKYNNDMTAKGSSKIYLYARQQGINCRRLTWNPNYKGIDDWQLALRQKEHRKNPEQKELSEDRHFESISWSLERECRRFLLHFWGLSRFIRLGISSRQQTNTALCVRWKCCIQRNMARQNDYNILRPITRDWFHRITRGVRWHLPILWNCMGRKDAGIFMWIRRTLNWYGFLHFWQNR